MHKTLRLVGSVLVSGGLLLVSHFANSNADTVKYSRPSQVEEDSLRGGLEILRRATWPLRDVSLCDPLRAAMANQATPAMLEPLDRHDVIICYRNGIDFNEASVLAKDHGLTWQRGLGGDRIVVFAPSRARFMQVAQENGMGLRDGDIQSAVRYLDRLSPHRHVRMTRDGWLIKPTKGDEEAFFGPYLNLSAGRYHLQLAFEADGADCRTLASEIEVHVAVTSDARKTSLVDRRSAPLAGDAAAPGRCRLSTGFDFAVSQASVAVETPIWIKSSRPLRLVEYDLADENQDASAAAPKG